MNDLLIAILCFVPLGIYLLIQVNWDELSKISGGHSEVTSKFNEE